MGMIHSSEKYLTPSSVSPSLHRPRKFIQLGQGSLQSCEHSQSSSEVKKHNMTIFEIRIDIYTLPCVR